MLDGQFGCVLKQHVLSKLLDQSHPTIRMTQHACQESSDTDEDDGAPALPPPSWASELVASARANAGESVYPPSDDTYLVLEALHADAVKLQKLQPRICLEVGTGTGVLSIGLGLVLQMLGVSMPVFVAVDKNPDATLVTAALFQQRPETQHVHNSIVRTSLVDGLRLHGLVDVGIFNPPYVVTPPEEMHGCGIEISWAGGLRGREVIDKFLPEIPLLLSPNGLFYLCGIEENCPDEILAAAESMGLVGCYVKRQMRGIETLFVLRLENQPKQL